MHNEVKDLFSVQVLEEAGRRFGIDASTLNLIGGFQNFIYEYKKKINYTF